jgi:hypothetical protein
VKPSLQQAVEFHRVVRHRGSSISYAIGSQKAVRLPALLAGRPLINPEEDYWHSFLLDAELNPRPQCGWKTVFAIRSKAGFKGGVEYAFIPAYFSED